MIAAHQHHLVPEILAAPYALPMALSGMLYRSGKAIFPQALIAQLPGAYKIVSS